MAGNDRECCAFHVLCGSGFTRDADSVCCKATCSSPSGSPRCARDAGYYSAGSHAAGCSPDDAAAD
jgi:hypothetical protein